MGAPKGDEYWAEWARDYCEVAKLWPHRPAVAYAQMIDSDSNTVNTAVKRLRRRGLITPVEEGFHLTPKAEAILNNLDVPAGSVVAFNVRVLARNKAQALAQLWNLETQLESWDQNSGLPFQPKEMDE